MIDTVLNAGDDLYKALGLDKDSLDLLTEDEKDEKIKSHYLFLSPSFNRLFQFLYINLPLFYILQQPPP